MLALFVEETHFGMPSPGLSLAQESPVTTLTQPFLPSFDFDNFLYYAVLFFLVAFYLNAVL